MVCMEDEKIIRNFARERGLVESTLRTYFLAWNVYSKFNGMSVQELLDEAEAEEESSVRWKNRKLKDRLIRFREYLLDNYMENTVKLMFGRIKTLYTHYEIEIHTLPPLNSKQTKKAVPLNFADLPDKEVIQRAIRISSPLFRSMILFMSSSGCALAETLSLTRTDFIQATSEYHNETDILRVAKALDGRDDVIPTFRLTRKKTNKHYFTFCSPEATQAIIDNLNQENSPILEKKYGHQLFPISYDYAILIFKDLNNKLHLGKRGTYNRFRSHMLRKFHASRLYNDGMDIKMVDALQGRGKSNTQNSYFLEDPAKLKEEYVKHLDSIMIDWNSVDVESPAYVQLKKEYDEKEEKVKTLDKRLSKLESMFTSSTLRKIER